MIKVIIQIGNRAQIAGSNTEERLPSLSRREGDDTCNNVEKLKEIVINQRKVFVLDDDGDEILFILGNINFGKFIINRYNKFFKNRKLDMKADLETVMSNSVTTYKTVVKYFPRINPVSSTERNDIQDELEIKD